MFDTIETKTDALRRCGHERREAFNALKHKLDAEWTFQEMAVSGTPLARMDVRRMVESKNEPNCRARVLREAYNFYRAIRFVDRFVPRDPRELGEAELLGVHALLVRGVNDKAAARYRDQDIGVLEPGKAAQGDEIEAAMNDTFAWLQSSSHQHPVRQATELHLRIVFAQPFAEMNARLARLLSNLVLMQRGLPPALLTGDDRADYQNAIAVAPRDGGRHFCKLIAGAVERTLDFCLQTVERAPVVALAK
jgi:Fic family protein